MDEYTQIMKMCEAAEILQTLVNADVKFADELQNIIGSIADLADEIEESIEE